jgi:hypothetical protein
MAIESMRSRSSATGFTRRTLAVIGVLAAVCAFAASRFVQLLLFGSLECGASNGGVTWLCENSTGATIWVDIALWGPVVAALMGGALSVWWAQLTPVLMGVLVGVPVLTVLPFIVH